MTSASDPDWIAILNCLRDMLLKRFEATKANYDVDRIVKFNAMKVAATPENHINWASRLIDQALMLGDGMT